MGSSQSIVRNEWLEPKPELAATDVDAKRWDSSAANRGMLLGMLTVSYHG